ncbi:hypothetical protein LMG3431_06222 [Achromobacter pestifer]|uniref:Uncharacterized protein n=1 Tax=Achromobacter pestifer TaxID=1353889 RepID=A0A6S7A6U7_9BURK|nr:hypothetical protein LMG3431_06222 [Achromobacter pestifer]
MEVLGAGVVDVFNAVTEGRHVAFDRGDAVVDGRDLVVGGLQLAAVDRVSAGVGQVACGDIGDFVRAGAAMIGAVGTRAAIGSRIPQQCIVFQAGHAVVDVRDVGVGLVKLRHVDCIAIGFAASDVGDLRAARLGGRVVRIARHCHGVVRAVVVHDGIRGGCSELCDVDGVGVNGAGGQAIDLAGLAVAGIAQAQGALRASPCGACVGGSRFGLWVVAGNASGRFCGRARTQSNAVADGSRRAVAQRDGV